MLIIHKILLLQKAVFLSLTLKIKQNLNFGNNKKILS